MNHKPPPGGFLGAVERLTNRDTACIIYPRRCRLRQAVSHTTRKGGEAILEHLRNVDVDDRFRGVDSSDSESKKKVTAQS